METKRNIALLKQDDYQHVDLKPNLEEYLHLPERIDRLENWQLQRRNRRLPRNRIERQVERSLNQYAELILECLPDDRQWYSRRYIGDKIYAIHCRANRNAIDFALKVLVEEEILEKARLHKYKSYRYLKKLFEIGDPVVEMQGTLSERYGVVEEFGYIKNKPGELFPIVRWQDGSRSFSSESLLSRVV